MQSVEGRERSGKGMIEGEGLRKYCTEGVGYYKRMQREGLGKNVSGGVLVKKGSVKY